MRTGLQPFASLGLEMAVGRALEGFWKRWRGKRKRRKGRAVSAAIWRRRLLIECGKKNFLRSPDYERLVYYRKRFDELGPKAIRSSSGACCAACGRLADIRHHIITLHHGGDNRSKNIVALCNTCHAIVHPHNEKLWRFSRSMRRVNTKTEAIVRREGELEEAARDMGLGFPEY